MPKQVDGIKFCPRCQQSMPVSEFQKNRIHADGLANYCRSCNNEDRRRRKKSDGSSRRWAAKNPHYFVAKQIGLTAEEARILRAGHGNSCQICGSEDTICLDHDHATNQVRGFLCKACNGGLGMFRDDPERLRAAARYLEG